MKIGPTKRKEAIKRQLESLADQYAQAFRCKTKSVSPDTETGFWRQIAIDALWEERSAKQLHDAIVKINSAIAELEGKW